MQNRTQTLIDVPRNVPGNVTTVNRCVMDYQEALIRANYRRYGPICVVEPLWAACNVMGTN